MKLSIVIICWNDLGVIQKCLESIYRSTRRVDWEIIVSDNASTDGSKEYILSKYPSVRVVANESNLGFAKGNNVGIRASSGEYVLILNPDTIIHDGALDKWVEFADLHPEAGAFGCRVVNPDGSYQGPARPFPTIWREVISALYLRGLYYMSETFLSDTYTGWKGETERPIDWQSGCCVMFRGELLRRLGGFDEQFFYQYEEIDLCRRVWNAGYPILYTPVPTITHLGGQSVGRFPVRFELERYRNKYRYFYKYFGCRGARRCRKVSLLRIRVRQIGYGALGVFRPSEMLTKRLHMYKVVAEWHKQLDPIRMINYGEEPSVNCSALV